jgi:hypothetical protein
MIAFFQIVHQAFLFISLARFDETNFRAFYFSFFLLVRVITCCDVKLDNTRLKVGCLSGFVIPSRVEIEMNLVQFCASNSLSSRFYRVAFSLQLLRSLSQRARGTMMTMEIMLLK